MSENNPQHIAFIMDGNGRWATKQGLSRGEGHKRGMQSMEEILNYCGRQEISYLSLYAFSTENWKRPEKEVKLLFRLLKIYFRRKLKTLKARNVRILISGDLSELPPETGKILRQAMEKTKNATGMTVNFCINYGSRREIQKACELWALRCRNGQEVSAPTEAEMQELLFTAPLPDVDLLIRTGGDSRISNFLLYQIAYAELFFTKTPWPDFKPIELEMILAEYRNRNRTMGGLVATGS